MNVLRASLATAAAVINGCFAVMVVLAIVRPPRRRRRWWARSGVLAVVAVTAAAARMILDPSWPGLIPLVLMAVLVALAVAGWKLAIIHQRIVADTARIREETDMLRAATAAFTPFTATQRAVVIDGEALDVPVSGRMTPRPGAPALDP